MSSLASALAYENEDVIGAFRDKYDVSLDDSRAFFSEVKKWLWLCAQARCAAKPLPVFDSMTWLDEMWHTFILFTLDYSRYCEERGELTLRRWFDEYPARYTAANGSGRARGRMAQRRA